METTLLESPKPWGWCTLINAAHCKPDSITDPKVFQAFIDELLEVIEMIKIGDLNIVWCNTNDPKKCGHSIYQLLQDSNVSAHFCPSDRNSAYMDIFSCKEYDPKTVVDIFRKYFDPIEFNYVTLDRKV